MKQFRRRAVLLLGFVLCGCAGRVTGDLKDIESTVFLEHCIKAPSTYALKYSTDAVDDYGDESLAGKVTSATFGLFPSYSSAAVHSQVMAFKDDQLIKTLQYQSRIQKFYGLIWLFVLPTDGVNWLQADEGGALRVRWGIHDKTITKAVMDLGLNPEADSVCESTESDGTD